MYKSSTSSQCTKVYLPIHKYNSMIFRTITDDITGANKSIGLFGKSLNDVKGIINSFKQNGFVSTLLNTPLINIDITAINRYNAAIRAGKTYEDALALARRTTNAETLALIESSHGAEVQIERVTKASTIAAKAHSATLKAVSTAGNMLAAFLITKGLELAVKGIDALTVSLEETIEKAEELRRKYEEFKSTNEGNVTMLKGLDEEFKELSKGVSQYGDNISLTTEQYERYKEIIRQIVGMSPSLAEGYNAENGYIADKNGLLERAIGLQEQEYRNELRKITNLENLKTSMSGYIAEYKKIFKSGFIPENASAFNTESGSDLLNALINIFNIKGREDYTDLNFASDIITSLGIENAEIEMEKFFNKFGGFELLWFFEEYADDIAANINVITDALSYDGVNLDEDEFENRILSVKDCAQAYLDMKDSISMANKSIQRDLGYIAEYADGYSDLTTEQKKFVNEFLKGFNIDDITSHNAFNGSIYYDNDKMTSVKRQIVNFVEALSQDKTTKSALSDFYAPIADDETVQDYVNRIKYSLEIIQEYCKKNKITVPINFNYSKQLTNDLEAQHQRAIDFATNKFDGYDPTEFFKEHSINTQEEIDVWQKIAQEVDNAAEAEERYIQYIKENQLEPELSEDKIKSINDYKNELKELYDVLNLLHTGKMPPPDKDKNDSFEEEEKKAKGKITPSDMDELIRKFPELSMYVDDLDEGISKLITDRLQLLKGAFHGLADEEILHGISKLSVMQESVTNSIETTNSAIDNITSSYQTLNQAVSEYNENGYLTIETLEQLMKLQPKYLASIINEDGSLKDMKEVYESIIDLRIEDMRIGAYKRANLEQAQLRERYKDDYSSENYQTEFAASQRALEKELEFIESARANLNKALKLDNSSSPTSDFEQHIDWASHSIGILQDKVSSLQDKLSDTSGYDNQIDAADDLIDAQKKLYHGYENTRDVYQEKYENILNNGIIAEQGLSEAVRKKIESPEDFSIEDFIADNVESGNTSLEQKIYEAIQEAIDWHNKKSDAEKNSLKIMAEIDESEMSKHDVWRKKWQSEIDNIEANQKSINDTIDFDGGKGKDRDKYYNDLILDEIQIRNIIFKRLGYEKALLGTLDSETDQYTEQEKIVRECEDGLAECDKNIKDWQLDMLRLELEAIDDEIDSINDKIKANQDEIDEKDKLISGAIGILNQEVKVQEGLRDVIQERIDALQEENDEHERALALEKAKYELQRAYSQRTVKLYSGEERGFIYTQDREAVRDAQENLDKLEYEETIHALQEQVGYYDDIIDNLNTIKDSWSNISSAAQEFLEIENIIAKYGVDIKDSILSGSYDTDGLTQSYKGLLHLGEEFDNDLKKQEDLRSDLEKSIEQFQNGTITLEQCLTDIGTLLGKVYDISESELQEKTENILYSIGFLPSEADNAGNTVKALEKEVKNSTGSIKDDINQITEDVDDTSSIAAGKVTENLKEETDKQRIIITDFAGYIDYVFTTMCSTILSIFQLLSNAMKDIFAPANTELPDMELGAMSNGSTTANDSKDLTQSAPSIGEEYTTASTYQEGNAVLTPFQNEQFETLIKNVPNMSALIPYHAVFMPNLNNSPTTITPVVQNITLTLPNVTNENGYGSLVNVLKSLPLDTVQYTHKK